MRCLVLPVRRHLQGMPVPESAIRNASLTARGLIPNRWGKRARETLTPLSALKEAVVTWPFRTRAIA